MMEIQDFEFEAVNAATSLLQSYDVTTDKWAFPQEGEFWRAIRAAHERGIRGKGCRIAIIDSAFDLTIPRLKQRASGVIKEWAAPSESTDHGTAVALLVCEVAPDAEIDFYSVGEHGHPDERLLLKALGLVAQSDAKLVNLSLGRRADKAPVKAANSNPEAHCDICKAAQAASLGGRLLVAAVGNRRGQASCPARDKSVLGIGFQTVKSSLYQTDEGGTAETSEWKDPSYNQAYAAKYTLVQPEGVLGSSFATPLATGALALCDDLTQIPPLFEALRLAGDAELFHDFLHQGDSRAVDVTRGTYLKALSKLPHRHGAQSAGDPCTMCSIFAQGLYVNAGLFFLEIGDLDNATDLLRAARWLAPWSPHALANHATLLRVKAQVEYEQTQDRDKALSMLFESQLDYARALEIRPGFEAYQTGLQEAAKWIFKLS